MRLNTTTRYILAGAFFLASSGAGCVASPLEETDSLSSTEPQRTAIEHRLEVRIPDNSYSDPEEPTSIPPPLCRGTEPGSVWSWPNMVGEIRHVKSSTGYVKLYMNADALESDDPTRGFYNSNHYAQSCGPTAGLNLFDWYGADDASALRRASTARWSPGDAIMFSDAHARIAGHRDAHEHLVRRLSGSEWLLQQLWGDVGTTSRDLGIGFQFHHRYLDSRGEFVYRVKGSAGRGLRRPMERAVRRKSGRGGPQDERQGRSFPPSSSR